MAAAKKPTKGARVRLAKPNRDENGETPWQRRDRLEDERADRREKREERAFGAFSEMASAFAEQMREDTASRRSGREHAEKVRAIEIKAMEVRAERGEPLYQTVGPFPRGLGDLNFGARTLDEVTERLRQAGSARERVKQEHPDVTDGDYEVKGDATAPDDAGDPT